MVWIFYNHFYWFITCLWKQTLPAIIFRRLCLQSITIVMTIVMTIFSKLIKICFLILINGSYKCCINGNNIKECIGCHDLMMFCLNISNIATITVKDAGYCWQFMTNLKQFTVCSMFVGMYEMHVKEINIKNRVYNYPCQTYGLM